MERTFFYEQWPEDIADTNKVRECVCGTCYQCGMHSFLGLERLFVDILERFGDLSGLASVVAHMRAEFEAIKELYNTRFFAHTFLHSRDYLHCRTFALSAPFGQQQASECKPEAHANHKGEVPSQPQDFVEWVKANHPQLVNVDGEVMDEAWNEECGCFAFTAKADPSKLPGHAKSDDRLTGYPGCGRGGQSQKRQPMTCDFCPNVAHNYKNCLDKEDPLDLEQDDYVCMLCLEKNDAAFHEMSCNECNRRLHAIAATRRLLTTLGSLGHTQSEAVGRYLLNRYV